MLEASLLAEDTPDGDLGAAISAHQQLVEARRARPARPGDPDRSRELAARPGWSWMRVSRSYDEYVRALAALEPGSPALAAQARALEPA